MFRLQNSSEHHSINPCIDMCPACTAFVHLLEAIGVSTFYIYVHATVLVCLLWLQHLYSYIFLATSYNVNRDSHSSQTVTLLYVYN